MACDKRECFYLSFFTVCKAQHQPHREGCTVLSGPAALRSSSQPPAPLQEVARLPFPAPSATACLGPTRATAFRAVFPQLEKPQARPAEPQYKQPARPVAFTFAGPSASPQGPLQWPRQRLVGGNFPHGYKLPSHLEHLLSHKGIRSLCLPDCSRHPCLLA